MAAHLGDPADVIAGRRCPRSNAGRRCKSERGPREPRSEVAMGWLESPGIRPSGDTRHMAPPRGSLVPPTPPTAKPQKYQERRNDPPISRLDCLEGIGSSRWRVVNGCSPMSTRHACKRDRRSSGVSGPPIETFRGVVDREATLRLLALTSFTHILCGNHSAVGAQTEELVTLADKKMRCTGRLLEHGCKVGFVPRAIKPWKRPKTYSRYDRVAVDWCNSIHTDTYPVWSPNIRRLS
jgi:hypothetical protein